MPNIGPFEILTVLVVALIVFGPKRLPELGKSLGKGIHEFRGTISGESTDTPSATPALGQSAAAAVHGRVPKTDPTTKQQV